MHPDSVRAALLTGMFGLQPRPTWAEVIVWFAYAVPFLVIVATPPRSAHREPSGRAQHGDAVAQPLSPSEAPNS